MLIIVIVEPETFTLLGFKTAIEKSLDIDAKFPTAFTQAF